MKANASKDRYTTLNLEVEVTTEGKKGFESPLKIFSNICSIYNGSQKSQEVAVE